MFAVCFFGERSSLISLNDGPVTLKPFKVVLFYFNVPIKYRVVLKH